MKLRGKFLLPIITLFFLGMTLLTVITYSNSKKELEKSVENQLNQSAESLARSTEEYLSGLRNDVMIWSDKYIPSMLSLRRGEVQADLVSLLSRLHALSSRSVDEGTLISCSDASQINRINVSERDYFLQSMKGQTVFSEVIKSKATGHYIFVVSTPVRVNGNEAGVFIGCVNMDNFYSKFVKPVKVGNDGFAYVMDKNSTVILHPKSELILKSNLKTQFNIDLGDKEKSFIHYSYLGVDKSVYFRGKGAGMDYSRNGQ